MDDVFRVLSAMPLQFGGITMKAPTLYGRFVAGVKALGGKIGSLFGFGGKTLGDDLVRDIATKHYKAGFDHLKQFMAPKERKAFLADP